MGDNDYEFPDPCTHCESIDHLGVGMEVHGPVAVYSDDEPFDWEITEKHFGPVFRVECHNTDEHESGDVEVLKDD